MFNVVEAELKATDYIWCFESNDTIITALTSVPIASKHDFWPIANRAAGSFATFPGCEQRFKLIQQQIFASHRYAGAIRHKEARASCIATSEKLSLLLQRLMGSLAQTTEFGTNYNACILQKYALNHSNAFAAFDFQSRFPAASVEQVELQAEFEPSP